MKKFNPYKLQNVEQQNVKGGHCSCSCAYRFEGGSSIEANGGANAASGYHSRYYGIGYAEVIA